MAWQQKQNRDALRDSVAEINAATRVPVEGEVSSYQQANTNNAFEAAVQALMQGGDQTAAEAMRSAWDRYKGNRLVDILMPDTAVSFGTMPTYIGAATAPVQTQTTPQQVPVQTVPTGTQNAETMLQPVGQKSPFTSEQLAAILADMGFANLNPFGTLGTTQSPNKSMDFFAEDILYPGGTIGTQNVIDPKNVGIAGGMSGGVVSASGRGARVIPRNKEQEKALELYAEDTLYPGGPTR